MNVVLVALIVLITAYGIVQAASVAWQNRKTVQSAGSAGTVTPEMDFGPASNSLLSHPSAAEMVCESAPVVAVDTAAQAACEAAPSVVGHAAETIAHVAGHFFHH